jgi:hypothetical protein
VFARVIVGDRVCLLVSARRVCENAFVRLCVCVCAYVLAFVCVCVAFVCARDRLRAFVSACIFVCCCVSVRAGMRVLV